jgi:hypothetical protein
MGIRAKNGGGNRETNNHHVDGAVNHSLFSTRGRTRLQWPSTTTLHAALTGRAEWKGVSL